MRFSKPQMHLNYWQNCCDTINIITSILQKQTRRPGPFLTFHQENTEVFGLVKEKLFTQKTTREQMRHSSFRTIWKGPGWLMGLTLQHLSHSSHGDASHCAIAPAQIPGLCWWKCFQTSTDNPFPLFLSDMSDWWISFPQIAFTSLDLLCSVPW